MKLKKENWLFGEDSSRYIITTNNEKKLLKYAKKMNVFIKNIGKLKEVYLKLEMSLKFH